VQAHEAPSLLTLCVTVRIISLGQYGKNVKQKIKNGNGAVTQKIGDFFIISEYALPFA